MTATAGTTVLPAIAPDSSDSIEFGSPLGRITVSDPRIAGMTVEERDDFAAHVTQRLEGGRW